MLGDFASHADEFGIDAIGLIIRRELTQLKELIERSKQIYRPLGAEWHVSEKMWRFPNGARLTFAYMDNDDDADRYQGASFSRIYIEEMGGFPDPKPIFKLMACIRSSNPKVRCGFRATGNPGGVGHCVPFGDVMTPNGWKPIESLKIGDPVYTVSNSGHLFTSRIEQVHSSRYIGDMVNVSARGLSMVCTPNHRVAKIYGEKRDRDKKFSLVPFHKLPGQATILRSVEWEGRPIGRVTPEVLPSKKRKLSQPKSLTGIQYAALVGWMVSEGCTIDREKAFAICQLKPHGRAKIVELLDDCGFSYMTQSTSFTCYAMEWWNHFRQLGKCRQKYIPEIVKNATKAELRAFFEAAMMGDGHWSSDDGGTYYTISKRLADDMAEVALKLGYIVYTSQRQRPDRDGLSYQVNFKKKKSGGTELLTGNHIYDVLTTTKKRSDIEMKPFDGMVYCIGVPITHNFVIRQNGSVWISGNSWIKNRYIMPAPKGMQVIKSKFENPFTKEEYEQERVFIPSKITDNRFNNTPQYVARLQMVGNARLVAAWLQGNWDIIEGAYFDEWDERKHVIDQFIIPAHWTRFTSMDWGSAKPFSVGWWAIVPDRFEPLADHVPSTFDPRYAYKNNLPRGAMVCYREWYGCQIDENGESMHNNVGLKLTIGQLAGGIAERERREPVNDQGRARMAYRVAGLDLFKEEGGPSLAERMSDDPYYQFWIKADNARIARKGAIGGWDMVRNRLIGENGEPMIYFFPNCVDSIRTLPALQHDKDNLEDVDTNSEDHAPDQIRYSCMSRPYSRPEGSPEKGRIMTVGPSNELQIKDVMGDFEAKKDAKFIPYKRI